MFNNTDCENETTDISLCHTSWNAIIKKFSKQHIAEVVVASELSRDFQQQEQTGVKALCRPKVIYCRKRTTVCDQQSHHAYAYPCRGNHNSERYTTQYSPSSTIYYSWHRSTLNVHWIERNVLKMCVSSMEHYLKAIKNEIMLLCKQMMGVYRHYYNKLSTSQRKINKGYHLYRWNWIFKKFYKMNLSQT